MAPAAQGREMIHVGDLVVDVGLQRVTGPSGEIVLPKLSFDLLLALVRRAPDLVSNDELSAMVWADVVVSPETVTKRVNLLRDALGDNAAQPRYIAGLRSRGYRIVAPVSAVERRARTSSPLRSLNPPFDRDSQPQLWPASRSRSRWPGGAAANAMLKRRSAATAEAVISDASVAVLPFENLSPSPDDAYLAVGVPEMVLDRLATMPRLTVIASGSAFRIDDLSATPGRSASDSAQGTSCWAARSVRVTSCASVRAWWTHTRVGKIWSTSLDRRLADLFAIQDVIATQVADELRRRVQGIALPRRYTTHEPPIEAQLAYLQGRAFLARHTVRGSETAAAKFAEAVALDPKFAAALAGLFDARMLAAERRHDDLAAERKRQLPLLDRALEIDPNCGSAYVARAIWGGGDVATQEADFRRGLELDPSNGRGLVAFSEFLDRQDRYDEGTRVLDRALLVDPLSPRLHFRLAMRDFDGKGEPFRESALRHVLEIDPDYQPALQRYSKRRWMLQGKLAEAVQIMEHAIEVDPDNPWSRHTATAMYLDLGDEPAAREVAEGTESSRETERLLLALYRGDWRTAGEVAYSPAGKEYNLAESWGAAEAVRDHALQTGDYRRGIAFLEERYKLRGTDPKLDITNFRAAAYLAQLLRASGDPVRAKGLLDRLPAEIDASIPRFESVFALRTKATVQLLSGDRQAALRTLAASFAANDLMQWWYTLNHDPLWKPLHDDPVFKALAAQVRSRVAQEQAELAELRRTGRIARRGVHEPGSKP